MLLYYKEISREIKIDPFIWYLSKIINWINLNFPPLIPNQRTHIEHNKFHIHNQETREGVVTDLSACAILSGSRFSHYLVNYYFKNFQISKSGDNRMRGLLICLSRSSLLGQKIHLRDCVPTYFWPKWLHDIVNSLCLYCSVIIFLCSLIKFRSDTTDIN